MNSPNELSPHHWRSVTLDYKPITINCASFTLNFAEKFLFYVPEIYSEKYIKYEYVEGEPQLSICAELCWKIHVLCLLHPRIPRAEVLNLYLRNIFQQTFLKPGKSIFQNFLSHILGIKSIFVCTDYLLNSFFIESKCSSWKDALSLALRFWAKTTYSDSPDRWRAGVFPC